MSICICTTPIRPEPTTFPPYGSMAIIQALRNIGEQASFYHIDFHRYSETQNLEYFGDKQFDFVGISSVVSTAYANTKNLVRLIKRVSPKTIVFVGGNLAASSNILHRQANVDYCVIGDGEIIVQNLIKTLKAKKTTDDDLNKIPGITYIDSQNKFKFTGVDHPLPADLIERPDFSILEDDNSIGWYIHQDPKASSFGYDEFIPNFKFEKGKTSAEVVVAKGCVARCTFCHRFEKGYRVSPLDSIINHLTMLKEKYNLKYLGFGDENFGSYKAETKKLVKELGRMGFIWKAGGVRAHTVDLEMLKFWKENGCVIVVYGIESGSPTMLKVMEKKISLEQNIKAMRITYEAGLSTYLNLVIGMPGETDETINETIDFILKVMPYYPEALRKKTQMIVNPLYAQALPGTPLYEYAREHGFIGKDVKSEEDYLLKISDTDAYDDKHFINYTQQPLLKVLSWRVKIHWIAFREHAKLNLKISISKLAILLSLLIIFVNKIFKLNLNSPLKRAFEKCESGLKDKLTTARGKTHFDNYAFFNYGLKLLIPWNKFTYPFILVALALKETRRRKNFKLIFEYIKWSLSVFKKINLPKETLREVINIEDDDETLELRKGR